MIISKTPYRISFFGGGTDYPAYYLEHGGQVLSTSIDKYCYISCRYLPPFFSHKHRIVYSIIECVNQIDEIQHPSVKNCFKYFDIQKGLEIHHDGDLPAKSGLGSSSAFTVGLINALNALNGKMTSKKELANVAIHIEQNLIKEAVGSQDQVACAYGGLNLIEFKPNHDIIVSPLVIRKSTLKCLETSLMMFFTGTQRYSSNIAETKIKNIPQKKQDLNEMYHMVQIAIDILQNSEGDLNDFGYLLHETWMIKRSLSSQVSSDFIDDIYEKAIKSGALGGKILGAGGGGFMLFFVPIEKQMAVRVALSHLIEIQFNFDQDGSKIIIYQND
jgi:D-glycero-alpha-D-manno-heptose-7-phosphate kinase